MHPWLTGDDAASTPGRAAEAEPAAPAGGGGVTVPALRDDAPCRLLGELLDLDAAWIVAPGSSGRTVTARWAREGAPSHRLGEARLAAVVEDVDREATQTRDGRYALLIAPLRSGGRAIAHLVGSARSPRAFRPDELRAAELVAAGVAASAGTAQPPADVVSTRARDRLLSQMGLLRSLTSRLAYARSEGEIAHAVVAELVRQDRFHAPRFYLRAEVGDEVALAAVEGGESRCRRMGRDRRRRGRPRRGGRQDAAGSRRVGDGGPDAGRRGRRRRDRRLGAARRCVRCTRSGRAGGRRRAHGGCVPQRAPLRVDARGGRDRRGDARARCRPRCSGERRCCGGDARAGRRPARGVRRALGVAASGRPDGARRPRRVHAPRGRASRGRVARRRRGAVHRQPRRAPRARAGRRRLRGALGERGTAPRTARRTP